MSAVLGEKWPFLPFFGQFCYVVTKKSVTSYYRVNN